MTIWSDARRHKTIQWMFSSMKTPKEAQLVWTDRSWGSDHTGGVSG